MSVRSFILSAWLGRGPSAGMALLIPRLRQFGDVSFHSWRETRTVVNAVNVTPGKVAIIGYSSGAAMLGFMERANTIRGYEREPVFNRDVDLGVAYDPRGPGVLGSQNMNGEWVVWVQRYKRLLDYHSNVYWPGDMRFSAPNIEIFEDVNLPHIFMQASAKLHNRTVEAVRMLADAR